MCVIYISRKVRMVKFKIEGRADLKDYDYAH